MCHLLMTEVINVFHHQLVARRALALYHGQATE